MDGSDNMFEYRYTPTSISVEEALELLAKSVAFNETLMKQLSTMDKLTTMQELFEGRSLIQEIYNELNYQVYMLQQFGLEDNNIKKHYNECIQVASLLEDRSGIPWDGRDICIR